MEDLGRLLTIALGIVSIATLAGLGLLRGVVTGLRERLKDSDEELERKDRRLTTAEAELKAVKTELTALTRVVTGEIHWIAIGEQLDAHHTAATSHWTRDETILEEIRDRLPPTSPSNPGRKSR